MAQTIERRTKTDVASADDSGLQLPSDPVGHGALFYRAPGSEVKNRT